MIVFCSPNLNKGLLVKKMHYWQTAGFKIDAKHLSLYIRLNTIPQRQRYMTVHTNVLLEVRS